MELQSARRETAPGCIAGPLHAAVTQETRILQRDRATLCVQLYNKSTTNRSNAVRGLQLIDCSKQPRLVDCRIGVVNKLDRRRRVLLTTRSTCRGEIFQVRSMEQSFRWKYSNFWRYRNFLITQKLWAGWKETCVPNTSSIRPVVSIQHRFVTDRQTDT